MDLAKLTTERRNPASAHIDSCSTLEMVTIMQQEDSKIAAAIEKILPEIARAIDETSQRLERGGRLFYLGAGTSGRLGILDASECPPTYGTDPELVQGLIAGGTPAIFRAQEGAEDNPDLAVQDLKEHDFTEKDVLVGIAASGRTPYVIGGLNYAKALGALTIALSCSEHSKIAALADIALTPVTGPVAARASSSAAPSAPASLRIRSRNPSGSSILCPIGIRKVDPRAAQHRAVGAEHIERVVGG